MQQIFRSKQEALNLKFAKELTNTSKKLFKTKSISKNTFDLFHYIIADVKTFDEHKKINLNSQFKDFILSIQKDIVKYFVEKKTEEALKNQIHINKIDPLNSKPLTPTKIFYDEQILAKSLDIKTISKSLNDCCKLVA